MTRYLKFVVAVVGAAVAAALTQFPDNTVVQQWGPMVTTILVAIGVYWVPNSPLMPPPTVTPKPTEGT